MFTIRESPYNLRNFPTLYSSNKRTENFGIKTITYNAFRYGSCYSLQYSNKKLKNVTEKHVLVGYAKPTFKKKDSFEYNDLKMDDRPDSVVVSHDLLLLCWHFACY